MRTSALARCCAALMPLLLMACGAMDTVHYAWPGPGRTDVVSVDAKLRHLIMTYGESGLMACSEAAPDAFSAFGSSLAGGLGIGAAERKAEAANAFATTAATIERTQTHNLLKDSFFRTCERVLSGKVDSYELATLAARDHRSMVSVLAIEQMTGVVKAPATVISGPAVSASRAQSEKLVELLESYRKERATADSEAKAANDKFVTANVLYPPGDAAAKPICDIDPAPTDPEAKAKYDTCRTAKDKAAETKTAAEEAKKRENAVLGQLDALAAGLSAATSAGTNNAGGIDYDKQQISDIKMALIAQSVEKIALTAGIDEALMFCKLYLTKNAFLAEDTTRAMCNTVIALRASQDTKNAADIVGTAATDIAEVLNFANDPTVMAEGKLTAASYDVFRLGLLAMIERTQDDKWPERWNAFATSTGVSVSECNSRTTCRTFFKDQNAKPLYANFRTNIKGFGDALDQWRKALVDDVENRATGEGNS